MTRRAFYWPILIIGVLFIVLPFAISMPSKTSAGQRMLSSFHPIMQRANVNTTVDYYNKTFVPLMQVAVGGVAAAGETNSMMSGIATAMHMTPAQLSQYFGEKYPAMAGLLGSFPTMTPVFSRVSPGLAFYEPLVMTMKANVDNYAQVDSLPNFNLFTWFFVVPGVLLVILSLLGLGLFSRKRITA